MKAEDLLRQARAANLKGDAPGAYKLAAESYYLTPGADAAKLMVLSACKMGDATLARRAFGKVKGSARDQVEAVCAHRGVKVQ